MSAFYRPQYAEDWTFLDHPCLPTNMDGITERHGRFLVLEVKRGEEISTGQHIMLERLSKVPKFTVVVVWSRHTPADDKNGREVQPWFYRVVNGDTLEDPVFTNPLDFKRRYTRWFDGDMEAFRGPAD